MDENRQAILLLSTQFSSPGKGAPTPLTALEYGRFAAWMKQAEFQPRDLFHRFDDLLEQWQDPKRKVTAERLQYLLGRGMAMGQAIEKWQSAGIWILTRSDSEYPVRLKKRLGEAAPAVLFGVGQKALLNAGGLAVVGSRKIGNTESRFTEVVAKQAAAEGLNLVSGGARGVDETAMLAALEIEGTTVGILANDLFKSALSGKWRKHLKSEQLALVSPFYPEARFQVGSAMGRNKHIYCLSDYALVVRSEQGSGGTWAGAIENLKKQWAPLFVACPSDADGNAALIEMGAGSVQSPESASSAPGNWLVQQLQGLAMPHSSQQSLVEATPAVPRTQENVISEPVPEEQTDAVDVSAKTEDNTSETQAEVVEPTNTVKPEPIVDPKSEQSYDEFMRYVSRRITENGETKFSELKESRKDLKQKQIREWLDQAVESGALLRRGRLLTYTLNQETIDQPDFFAD